jgi:hypothetical protein
VLLGVRADFVPLIGATVSNFTEPAGESLSKPVAASVTPPSNVISLMRVLAEGVVVAVAVALGVAVRVGVGVGVVEGEGVDVAPGVVVVVGVAVTRFLRKTARTDAATFSVALPIQGHISQLLQNSDH